MLRRIPPDPPRSRGSESRARSARGSGRGGGGPGRRRRDGCRARHPALTGRRTDATFQFEPYLAIGRLATSYAPEKGLSIWLPLEMTERYEDLPNVAR